MHIALRCHAPRAVLLLDALPVCPVESQCGACALHVCTCATRACAVKCVAVCVFACVHVRVCACPSSCAPARSLSSVGVVRSRCSLAHAASAGCVLVASACAHVTPELSPRTASYAALVCIICEHQTALGQCVCLLVMPSRGLRACWAQHRPGFAAGSALRKPQKRGQNE